METRDTHDLEGAAERDALSSTSSPQGDGNQGVNVSEPRELTLSSTSSPQGDGNTVAAS